MFPVSPPRETLLRKQNLLPRKQKCFSTNSETFLLRKQCETMFPCLPTCFQVFPARETLFSRLGMLQQSSKLVRAKVSHGGKNDKISTEHNVPSLLRA